MMSGLPGLLRPLGVSVVLVLVLVACQGSNVSDDPAADRATALERVNAAIAAAVPDALPRPGPRDGAPQPCDDMGTGDLQRERLHREADLGDRDPGEALDAAGAALESLGAEVTQVDLDVTNPRLFATSDIGSYSVRVITSEGVVRVGGSGPCVEAEDFEAIRAGGAPAEGVATAGPSGATSDVDEEVAIARGRLHDFLAASLEAAELDGDVMWDFDTPPPDCEADVLTSVTALVRADDPDGAADRLIAEWQRHGEVQEDTNGRTRAALLLDGDDGYTLLRVRDLGLSVSGATRC